MDLRVKRTLKSIKDAFYELRKKKPIEKISVKELSELAMINKATFYLHYKDIYDLFDKLENELILEIIREIENISPENNQFESFARKLNYAIIDRTEEINTLFSGYSDTQFINHLEDSLKEYIFTVKPEYKNNEKMDIILTFMIQGTYHTHLRSNSDNKQLIVNTTTDLFLRLTDFQKI